MFLLWAKLWLNPTCLIQPSSEAETAVASSISIIILPYPLSLPEFAAFLTFVSYADFLLIFFVFSFWRNVLKATIFVFISSFFFALLLQTFFTFALIFAPFIHTWLTRVWHLFDFLFVWVWLGPCTGLGSSSRFVVSGGYGQKTKCCFQFHCILFAFAEEKKT